MSLFNGISLLDLLSQWEQDTLSCFCQERYLHNGEILFHEWDEASAFYIVKSWVLKAYRERSDGEQLLGFIKPNELAWEMAIFDPDIPYKRVATVVATADTLLLVMLKEDIVELSKKHSEIYEKIAQIIKERRKAFV